MTVQIIQTCDGCNASRTLKNLSEAENVGWREVGGGTHLCTSCIDKAIASGREQP